jgi:hypothetical protein
MFNLNQLNNVNDSKSIKEEIIKSKIGDSYQVQLTDYIFLQNKVNSIINILTHKPQLTTLDYTKLNRYYNFSKSIIISKKRNQNDDIDLIKPQSSNKNKGKDNFFKNFCLGNPILKKIFLSKKEENKSISAFKKENSRQKNVFQQNKNNGRKTLVNLKCNHIYIKPKNDLYKLPKQIKNKFQYNLEDIKNNAIKRKYQIKERLSKFDKFARYFMRGLSLSEEQNLLYQKCKKIDLSLNEDRKKKIILDDISSNSNYHRKNNNKLTRLNKTVIRKKNNSKKNRINSAQTYNNKALFKYSLKDVLNMENPIKILL